MKTSRLAVCVRQHWMAFNSHWATFLSARIRKKRLGSSWWSFTYREWMQLLAVHVCVSVTIQFAWNDTRRYSIRTPRSLPTFWPPRVSEVARTCLSAPLSSPLPTHQFFPSWWCPSAARAVGKLTCKVAAIVGSFYFTLVLRTWVLPGFPSREDGRLEIWQDELDCICDSVVAVIAVLRLRCPLHRLAPSGEGCCCHDIVHVPAKPLSLVFLTKSRQRRLYVIRPFSGNTVVADGVALKILIISPTKFPPVDLLVLVVNRHLEYNCHLLHNWVEVNLSKSNLIYSNITFKFLIFFNNTENFTKVYLFGERCTLWEKMMTKTVRAHVSCGDQDFTR